MKQIIIVTICMVASSAVPVFFLFLDFFWIESPFSDSLFHINFTPLSTPVPSHTAEENGPFTPSPDVEQTLSKLPKDQQQTARNMLNSLTQLAQVLNEVAQAIQKDPEGFKAAVMKNLQSLIGSSYPGIMKPEAQ